MISEVKLMWLFNYSQLTKFMNNGINWLISKLSLKRSTMPGIKSSIINSTCYICGFTAKKAAQLDRTNCLFGSQSRLWS